jgi:N-acetylmuramoyl-L-alanine amidase
MYQGDGLPAVSFAFQISAELRRRLSRFDMLLNVRIVWPKLSESTSENKSREYLLHAAAGALVLLLPLLFLPSGPENISARTAGLGQTPPAASSTKVIPAPLPSTPAPAAKVFPPPSTLPPNALNVIVLDAAHGGTDPGARGTGGIRESEVVLQFATQIRRALESQGFQVVQTRLGDENPSFDDRSAMANAQRGAVFITLHISSTGLPGTARVYVNADLPRQTEANGLLPWDQAQAPFLDLSRKLGDTVQGLLAQRFKGSPSDSQTAEVRQLRTTAAPAIAVEISSVSVERREDLDRMAPGVADAIARGVVAFKPSYVVATPAAAPAAPTSPTGATR